MSALGKQLSVYYHTHWDREWYLPFRLYQARLADVVDEVLERLESGGLPCFMLDGQTVALDDYLEIRPQNRERLQRLIQSGRLSIGPWYAMPDEFLVSGESLLRNLKRGMKASRDWGCRSFTGYLPDTFGHTGDIPTILCGFGLDTAVVWRGVNPNKSLFRWESPSGASVLACHLTDGYFQMMLHDWTATDAEKRQALDTLVNKLESVSLGDGLSLLPIGGDHLAPVSADGYAMLKARYPNLTETTPDKYLAQVQGVKALSLETIQGELTENSGSFLLPGVYSSRMYLKQANRRLEHQLTHQVEPLLAMAQLLLPDSTSGYPEQALDVAWKTLLLNHPHDSICGCSVDAVHRENEVRFDQVQQLADAMRDRAQSRFANTVGAAEDWVLFNTSDQPYTGVVEVIEDVPTADIPTQLHQVATETIVLQDEYLHDGHRIPLSHLTKVRRRGWVWAESLPPYSVTATAKTRQMAHNVQPVKVEKHSLENERLKIQVEADGTLHITDRQTGRSYPGLLTFWNKPDQGDSYNSAPVPGSMSKQARLTDCKIVAQGPLVGILELTHCFESDWTLVTQARLDAGSPMLRLETTFTNRAENHKLQVAFPTGQPITQVAAESHLSIVNRRYDPNYRELDAMPVERMKELKTNTGPVQRFWSVNGQSFLTEGLCEYEVYQETVSITLLRAFSHLSKGDMGVRGAQAGPPFETPEGQCLNRTFQCRYAWLPTPDEPQSLYRLADQFYGTVWGVSGSAADAVSVFPSLVSWDNPVLVATATYYLPGQGLVLRLLNTTGHVAKTTLKPGFAVGAVHCLNFLDEPQERLSGFEVTIPAWNVQTLLLAL